jgi:hypothetical protein
LEVLKGENEMGDLNLRPPVWNELPEYARKDLGTRGFDQGWFTDGKGGGNEEIRLTVLNIYAKLRKLTIAGIRGWDFVGKVRWADVGAFIFEADEPKLRTCLTRERNFADPTRGPSCSVAHLAPMMPVITDCRITWDSRELCSRASIHFRKETDHEATVHIDPDGLFAAPGLLAKVDPIQWARHWVVYKKDTWNHVGFIRGILLGQGYPAELLQQP